jgi:hypothetical protein
VLSAVGAVSANTWQHIVVTRETATKTVRFYVDGVARGVGVSATVPAVGPRPLSIGRSQSGIQYANGSLADVAVYATTLNPQQIARHYAMRKTDSTGIAVELQLQASDPGNQALTYSAVGLPPGLTINAATGLISGILTSAAAGMYQVTVMASNGYGSQMQSFDWIVTHAQPAFASSVSH